MHDSSKHMPLPNRTRTPPNPLVLLSVLFLPLIVRSFLTSLPAHPSSSTSPLQTQRRVRCSCLRRLRNCRLVLQKCLEVSRVRHTRPILKSAQQLGSEVSHFDVLLLEIALHLSEGSVPHLRVSPLHCSSPPSPPPTTITITDIASTILASVLP